MIYKRIIHLKITNERFILSFVFSYIYIFTKDDVLPRRCFCDKISLFTCRYVPLILNLKIWTYNFCYPAQSMLHSENRILRMSINIYWKSLLLVSNWFRWNKAIMHLILPNMFVWHPLCKARHFIWNNNKWIQHPYTNYYKHHYFLPDVCILELSVHTIQNHLILW